MSDRGPPLVRDALEHHDCAPRGPEHQFRARCPAHPDRHPSLSIGTGPNGEALIKCHKGCSTAVVLDKLGLTFADLYPSETRVTNLDDLERQYAAGQLHPEKVTLGPLPEDCTDDMRRIAQDMTLLIGLRAAAGEKRPLLYSVRFLVAEWGGAAILRARAPPSAR